MPRIIPEPRYFSIPSIELGAEVLRNRALNCWPWARSLIHSPDSVIHSPAEIIAAWPTTVTKSRWPRAFALRTQKPFSALWKVTRSTRPASTSWVDGSRLDFIRIAGSSVLSLGATSVEPHRRRIIGAGQRADGARCRARTNAMDGRNRREADIADRRLGHLNWPESVHLAFRLRRRVSVRASSNPVGGVRQD